MNSSLHIPNILPPRPSSLPPRSSLTAIPQDPHPRPTSTLYRSQSSREGGYYNRTSVSVASSHPTSPAQRPMSSTSVNGGASAGTAAGAVGTVTNVGAGGGGGGGPGLRYPSNKKTIYDRNLNRTKNAELSRAAFAYLFVELIAYAQRGVRDIATLEKRLNSTAYPLGHRLLDLLLLRSPSSTSSYTSSTSTTTPSIRPTRISTLIQWIAQTLWRHLFGRPADALERSATDATQYMLYDNDPLVNQYISLPREINGLNCAAFVAGIVEGVCDGAGFATEGVSAHTVGAEGGTAGDGGDGAKGGGLWPGKTVFLIKFKKEVLEREEILSRGSGG